MVCYGDCGKTAGAGGLDQFLWGHKGLIRDFTAAGIAGVAVEFKMHWGGHDIQKREGLRMRTGNEVFIYFTQ